MLSAMVSVLNSQTTMTACFSSSGEGYRKGINSLFGIARFFIVTEVVVVMIQLSKNRKGIGSNEEI
jgi:hypothetical protein